MRKKPTQATVNKLLSLSGNQCAFPNCEENLVNAEGTLIGEICHIEAAEPGGERYNPEQDDEDRRSLSNLLLLCANHHRATNNIDIYDVATLGEIKAEHEKRYHKNPYAASEGVRDQLDQILESIEKPKTVNSYSVEIVTDSQHRADMAEIQHEFNSQAQNVTSRLSGTSAAAVAQSAYQSAASKKRRNQMRKKANSDRMYELEKKDIEDEFAEKADHVKAEMGRRGMTHSGENKRRLAQVREQLNRELEKLQIKYGKNESNSPD